MNLTVTLLLLACAIAGFLAAWRIAARPADPLKPRLLSWNLVMIVSVFVAFLMIVNLVNLAGIETGRSR